MLRGVLVLLALAGTARAEDDDIRDPAPIEAWVVAAKHGTARPVDAWVNTFDVCRGLALVRARDARGQRALQACIRDLAKRGKLAWETEYTHTDAHEELPHWQRKHLAFPPRAHELVGGGMVDGRIISIAAAIDDVHGTVLRLWIEEADAKHPLGWNDPDDQEP